MIFSVLCCLGLVGGCRDPRWDAARIQQSQEIGDEIIQAIEAYKLKGGVYPPTLDALVPKYLGGIRQPVAGECQWKYHRSPDGGFYSLLFEESGSHPRRYSRSTGSKWWNYDSGGL